MSEKVCHISTAHPPFDVRIFHKECVSLVKAGFDVSLVVTHDKEETVEGVKIVPLPNSKGRFHRMFIKTHFAFYRSLKTKAKIYHFHDPELMIVGILLRIMGKKVIFDSHENVSSQIESKKWLGGKFIRTIIKNLYRLFERFAILFFDTVISVTPEIVEFLSPKKGLLIRNFPILSLIDEVKVNDKDDSVTTFVYAGGLTKIRGIKEICQAIESSQSGVRLILMGKWESETFKEECIGASNKIEYLGMLRIKEVYNNMKKSDVGLVTLFPEKNYLNSYPIKVFEYMACSLPVIISDFPYWKNMFGASYSEFVDPLSVEKITEKIDYFVKNRDKIKSLGEKAYEEVKLKYSWEVESQKLIKIYMSYND